MAVTNSNLSTRYTFDFIRANLTPDTRTILEIGCGQGELACALKDAGYSVLAIDSDPDCTEAARAMGADARLMSWPAHLEEQFDAVLFTRSLHHVGPLDDAIAAAIGALRPGGKLIVEDFRAEGGSRRSGEWFRQLAQRLADNDNLRDPMALPSLVTRIDHSDHDHNLHTSSAIRDALMRRGKCIESDAAYYFRYVEPELRSEEAAEAVLREELRAISGGAIDPLGKRFVLTPAA